MIVKGTLNCKSLKFRVLDEADEMLNMGFVDDVELILGTSTSILLDFRSVLSLELSWLYTCIVFVEPFLFME